MNLHILLDKRWKKLLWIALLLAFVLYLVWILIWLRLVVQPSVFNPMRPPQMQLAEPSFRDVVGDLGGVPVTIPRYFAHNVEYDNDPGWGERRKGPRPERTHSSKLKSFGFDVRYPDMAGLSSPELEADKRKQNIHNTMWMRVGIKSGEIYPGEGFMDRKAETFHRVLTTYRYEKQAEKVHGLTVHTPIGVATDTRVPFKSHSHDQDVFVHRNSAGGVDAYIECSNVEIPSAPCSHHFGLGTEMKVEVHVSYRRGYLPEWQQIQTKVAHLIRSWTVTASATLPSVANTNPPAGALSDGTM